MESWGSHLKCHGVGCHEGGLTVVFEAGQWLIPDRYNQGAYDAAVFIASDDDKLKLRFVNVTRTVKRHNINCSYMAALLTALELNWTAFHRHPESDQGPFPVIGVEFVWIRPFEKLSTAAIQCSIFYESDVTQTAANFAWAEPKTSEIFIKRTGSP
eukprot:m.58718 g.58718  ORF g.58718 m.58718 type:complete len:156 (-) comp9425_c2_seq1:55-522(-)